MSDEPVLENWVVYLNPTDVEKPPGFEGDLYVVRRWLIVAGQGYPEPTQEAYGGPSLDAIRQMIPAYADTLIARDPDDDPVIVEIWMGAKWVAPTEQDAHPEPPDTERQDDGVPGGLDEASREAGRAASDRG